MKRAALVLGGLVAGFLVAELVLRVIGFHYQYLPRVQFGFPGAQALAERYATDPDLLWVTKDYSARLKAAQAAHPAIVFMGDSCTEYGIYPQKTVELLQRELPVFSGGFNAGTGGWSTQEGVWQLERDVAPLRPKVITVYFGWNDHWVALGAPDADARPGRASYWFSQLSRVGQLIARARAHPPAGLAERPERVGLARYRQNLETLVREGRQAGAQVVLITAATSHELGHEPEYLKERWIGDLSRLVPLHRAYVQATRDVAASTGAVLCDAAAAYDADPARAEYLTRDGIHLTDRGGAWLARLVADCAERALGRP